MESITRGVTRCNYNFITYIRRIAPCDHIPCGAMQFGCFAPNATQGTHAFTHACMQYAVYTYKFATYAARGTMSPNMHVNYSGVQKPLWFNFSRSHALCEIPHLQIYVTFCRRLSAMPPLRIGLTFFIGPASPDYMPGSSP